MSNGTGAGNHNKCRQNWKVNILTRQFRSVNPLIFLPQWAQVSRLLQWNHYWSPMWFLNCWSSGEPEPSPSITIIGKPVWIVDFHATRWVTIRVSGQWSPSSNHLKLTVADPSSPETRRRRRRLPPLPEPLRHSAGSGRRGGAPDGNGLWFMILSDGSWMMVNNSITINYGQLTLITLIVLMVNLYEY